MDDLILPGKRSAHLVKNEDGTLSVAGAGIRQDEPTVLVNVNRIPVPGQTVKVDAEDTIMAAARMQRDGASMEQIREYLGDPMLRMPRWVGGKQVDPGEPMPENILQQAIDVGHRMLTERIASGQEPEETITQVRIPLAIWLEGESPIDDESDD